MILKHIFSKESVYWIMYYFLLFTRLDRIFPDTLFLKIQYRCMTGNSLDLKAPRTYTQKLQWLKLYDRNPLYTIMVDKYRAKEYVSNCIGSEYVVPLLGVWDSPEEIEWDKLPKQFVLKTNHDCGGLIICKDKSKFDKEAAKEKLRRSLKNSYWLSGREWPYKDMPRKIIAEKYIEDSTGGLVDYKVMCFNGKPRLIQVHLGRYTNNHTQDFYDIKWNKTNITQGSYGETSDIYTERPICLDEMLKLSEVLSANIPHVRVDWYIVDNHLYLGELTFFDASGFDMFDSNNDEEMLGSWIKLPEKTFGPNPSSKGYGNEGIDMFY